MRAVPASMRRASLRVEWCSRIDPSRGSTTRRRSAVSQTLSENAHDGVLRCLDLNLGNPACAALVPLRALDQFN